MKKWQFWRSRGIARGISQPLWELIGLGFGDRKSSVSLRRPVLGVRGSLGGAVGVKNARSGERAIPLPLASGHGWEWIRWPVGLRRLGIGVRGSLGGPVGAKNARSGERAIPLPRASEPV